MPAETRPVQERRTEERYPPSPNTFCSLASPVVETFGPVRLKNISREGIGFLTNKKVEPGTLMALELKNNMKATTKVLLVKLMHVTPQTGGVYLAGGTFSVPLTFEELMTLMT